MAKEGNGSNTRSRSPKSIKVEGESPALSFDSLWDKIGPELNAFEDKIKGVVGALVNQEVARIEKKLDGNQDENNKRFASMESKFDKLESNLDQKFIALPATIAGNPHPLPAGTGPNEAASSGDGNRPSYAAMAATPAPFVVEDVTTPAFNRKLNPTIWYCNVHDKT